MAEKVEIFIPVSEVFPDTQSDLETFKSLLYSLSLTDTLFWCGRLNLIISDPESDHLTKQQAGLTQFFTPEEINKVNDFARTNKDSEITVFFRGQLLELIRWVVLFCSDFPEDGRTFEDPIIRRSFAKAALIASDIWSNRVFGNRFSSEGDQTIARKQALGAIRKSIEGTFPAPHLIESIGKGWGLFPKYFRKHYKSFDNQFQKATHLSVDEYYACVVALAINFTNSKINSGLMNIYEMDNAVLYGSALKRCIDLESQTIDELKVALWGNITASNLDKSVIPDFNYLPIREKPIFYTKDGRAIILDPRFYIETMTVGPLFLLQRKNRWEAFTHFGKAFEDYVCDILRRMFPDLSAVVNQRLSCNITGKDQDGQVFEIDACLNDITDIVLFEAKTGFIPEENILNDNYELFLDDLQEKYVQTVNENKGIGQLAKLVQILASKKWLGKNQEFDKVKRIYPVMVVHDSLLTAPGYGWFFALEFVRLLLIPDTVFRTGECIKGDMNITLPIIMSIDDLENLETSIEHFGFRDLLSDYSKSCPDRMESLHNFIASSRYKQHMYHNKNLAALSIDILEKSKKTFFKNAKDIKDSV